MSTYALYVDGVEINYNGIKKTAASSGKQYDTFDHVRNSSKTPYASEEIGVGYKYFGQARKGSPLFSTSTVEIKTLEQLKKIFFADTVSTGTTIQKNIELSQLNTSNYKGNLGINPITGQPRTKVWMISTHAFLGSSATTFSLPNSFASTVANPKNYKPADLLYVDSDKMTNDEVYQDWLDQHKIEIKEFPIKDSMFFSKYDGAQAGSDSKIAGTPTLNLLDKSGQPMKNLTQKDNEFKTHFLNWVQSMKYFDMSTSDPLKPARQRTFDTKNINLPTYLNGDQVDIFDEVLKYLEDNKFLHWDDDLFFHGYEVGAARLPTYKHWEVPNEQQIKAQTKYKDLDKEQKLYLMLKGHPFDIKKYKEGRQKTEAQFDGKDISDWETETPTPVTDQGWWELEKKFVDPKLYDAGIPANGGYTLSQLLVIYNDLSKKLDIQFDIKKIIYAKVE